MGESHPIEEEHNLFELRDPANDNLLVFAKRERGVVYVYANTATKGVIDLGQIEDVWRENSDLNAELFHIRQLLSIEEDKKHEKVIKEVASLVNLVKKIKKVTDAY